MSATGFLSEAEEAQLNQVAGDGSGFDDGFTFSTEGCDPDDIQRGGWIDREGNYHFEVSDVKVNTEEGKTPHLEFALTVLHSVNGQCAEGSKFTHRMYLTDKEGGIRMNTLFGLRTGALLAKPTGEKDQKGNPKHIAVDPKTGTTRVTLATWQAIKGSQFVGQVKTGKPYTGADGKERSRLELQIGKCYPVDAEEVADVPKNVQAMKVIGKKPFEKPKSAPPAASKPMATTKPSPTPTPASAVDQDLSDL